MNTKFELSQEFIDSKIWINLNDLFTTDRPLLPDWVGSLGCIYYIRNKYNGKGYVGQAKKFL